MKPGLVQIFSVLRPKYRVSQAQVRLTADRPVALGEIPCLDHEVLPHDHDYHECTMVLGGEGMHRTADGDWVLGRGAVVVLAPEEVHGFRVAAGGVMSVWNLYYLAEWLLVDLPLYWAETHFVELFLGRQLFPRYRRERVPEFFLTEAEVVDALGLVGKLRTELQTSQPSLVLLKSVLVQLLVVWSRAFARSAPANRRLAFRPEVWQLIGRVDELLRRGERFEVGEEARRVGLTRDYLTKLFREETGRSPMEYYQARRIETACVRLLDKSVDFTELAHDLRFSDSAHFSRQFRAHRGMSPREYRAEFTGARERRGR